MESLHGEIATLIFQGSGDTYRVYKTRSQDTIRVRNRTLLPAGAKFHATGHWKPFRNGNTFEIADFIDLTTRAGHRLEAGQPAQAAPLRAAPASIIHWLISAKIPGVGKVTGQKLLAACGDQLEDYLRDAQRLASAAKIPLKRAQPIVSAWTRGLHARVHAELMTLGLPKRVITTLIEEHGDAAPAMVTLNPWAITRYPGCTFTLADTIAQGLGFDLLTQDRIQAAILQVIDDASKQGHTGLDFDAALEMAAKLLNQPIADIKSQYPDALDNVPFVRQGAYLDSDGTSKPLLQKIALHDYEHGISAFIYQRRQVASPERDRESAALIRRCAVALKVNLDPSQLDAAAMAISRRISLISGAAGTGKTMTTRCIIAANAACGLKTMLLAPTGRAAKVIAEATGTAASTIHRALQIDPSKEDSDKTECLDADHIIVDEASMIDTWLFMQLIKRIGPHTHLTLVGDPNQLPSVGPGNLLQDFIASSRIAHQKLAHIHRQGPKSDIIETAAAIQAGQMPALKTQGEAIWLQPGKGKTVKDLLEDLISNELLKNGVSSDDIQVLSPMRKGEYGTVLLNRFLKGLLNPGLGQPFLYNDIAYHIGDKVIHVRNDYEKEVFNGDIGQIADIDHDRREMLISYADGDVLYNDETFGDLQPAFAMTIHKAQGGQYPTTIFLIDDQQWNASRRLLYTGVTRATKKLYILASSEAMRRAIGRTHDSRRMTGLGALLKAHRPID